MFHSGTIDLAAAGRRGGQARRKKEEHAGDRLEARAYDALEELLSSGSSTARVAAAKYALDRLTANSSAGLEVAKRALWLDQQVQMQAELPFARAKLERLVEARARVTAEEMYEERKRLDLEAVAAELRVDAPAPATPPADELIAEEQRRQTEERTTREQGKP